jgi:multicomponent Na+:H+ antiporter subunit G
MVNDVLAMILNLLAAATLLGGLFFLFVGAVGVYRLPDAYNRIHAASKSITLGIIGVLLAAVLHLSAPDDDYTFGEAVAAATKAVLVIAFQFVAAPVASHMLARAAHLDGAPQYKGTMEDDLAEDGPHEGEGDAAA